MTTLFDLRKINQNDKNEFMTMSRDFYNSDAVSAPVPENFHEQAFSDLMAGTPYAECLFFTHGNQVAGFALLAKTYSREAGGECVWVEELYLKPEFRGMGAAKTFFGKLSALYPAARYRSGTRQRTGKKTVPCVRFYFPSLRTNEKRLLILNVKRRSEHVASGAFLYTIRFHIYMYFPLKVFYL